ncbi:hypothetical protein LTR70_002514 [Exophiala xenobiotica]|uniref:Reticulon-like protein n=1 Tax=Lithohypha guttulata TaxID=1690604 RepID=A0ABR0KK76_9EURO|nr:hypothetical protein LTR24_001731 [Lithohypha guttulata]KAK5325349.1 hypothetical protein LTR70_002514 [Exophiala xenobiotica]
MSALDDVSRRVDPGSNSNSNNPFNTNTSSNTGASNNAQAAQEHAAGLAETAKNSEAHSKTRVEQLGRAINKPLGAANAYNQAANSQFAQDLANGPAAQSVKNQAQATGNEFSDLAGSRTMPDHKAANDTPLTHYHNFFFNLLSWKNPRATGVTFASFIALIFASRYLPIVRLALKGTWTVLGVVTLAEAAAKFTIGSSVAGSVRPRRYYKIPKETLEATLDDVEQLINFFVIEAQRIVFAENIPNTALAFTASFASYYLVKLLPAWGFALFATCVTFLVPLVYTQNKELIDSQYEHVSNVAIQQTQQFRDLTAQQTSKAAETVKAYTGEYANVASEYIGKSRQKIQTQMPSSSGTTNGTTSGASNGSNGPINAGVTEADFPQAPKAHEADFPQPPQTDFASSSGLNNPGMGAPEESINASKTPSDYQ